jgi:polyphosphate kinase
MAIKQPRLIHRDISWLGFNARVLQEATDPTVPLNDRIKFLAIHSNNLTEFFSIRVPALKAELKLAIEKKNAKEIVYLKSVLHKIHTIVIDQQNEFTRIWDCIVLELKKHKIYLLTENELNETQTEYIHQFYHNTISPNIIPLFVESLPPTTSLWAKGNFMGVVMRSKDKKKKVKYAIIQIPTKAVGRFLALPSKGKEQNIILLEDIIRFHLPYIFSSFGYDSFDAHLFKVTQNAEIGFDSDLSKSYVQRIESALKSRRTSKPICFLYDKEMDRGLLKFLMRWFNLTKDDKDSLIPRGRIRNFRDFLNFPAELPKSKFDFHPLKHPDLATSIRVSDVIFKHDVLICTPYHSFNAIIDMLREAAMDENVKSIKLTAYRLARHSKICNALINAARNGKKVEVVIEIKATYNEEGNLYWKNKLEEEGVKVHVGEPNFKIHAKLCVIKKVVNDQPQYYGFIGTGNLNEETAMVYADYFLLTSDPKITHDMKKIFKALRGDTIKWKPLKKCKTLIVSPLTMRKTLTDLVDREIENHNKGLPASVKLEVNALSDDKFIQKLYEGAQKGLEISMIVRSIMCAVQEQKSFKKPFFVTSIVDGFLEHGRAWIFENSGKKDVFITSADCMVRNFEYRLEIAVPISDPLVKQQLLDIIDIKFKDNVKARVLDNNSSNHYYREGKKKIRSQLEIYNYLQRFASHS